VPLLSLTALGEGKVLFSALPPFPAGADTPFPYLLSAIQRSLFLTPAGRSKRLEVYFDYGEHEDNQTPEAKRWAQNGARAVRIAAWHQWRGSTRRYDRLIAMAHQNAMLAYAWLPLPQVSMKFWEDHPEWREKDLAGEDAQIDDFRKAMSLVDPACRE